MGARRTDRGGGRDRQGASTDRAPASGESFAFVLVKLDGADTALANIVTDELERVRVGSRVEVVWTPDEAWQGSIRDIACFRVTG